MYVYAVYMYVCIGIYVLYVSIDMCRACVGMCMHVYMYIYIIYITFDVHSFRFLCQHVGTGKTYLM